MCLFERKAIFFYNNFFICLQVIFYSYTNQVLLLSVGLTVFSQIELTFYICKND